MSSTSHCVHFDLDGAWPHDATPLGSHVDCRAWGPRLRYSTSEREVAAFEAFILGKTAPFTLFGSGDFHHLSALWIRRITEPFTLVSFDNHPDWDIRPPRWCCGTWINRALESSALQHAAIWGCGNFELNWPGSLYVNRRALREKRLTVWPWTTRLQPSGCRRWPGLERESWRENFASFAASLARKNAYVTVDLDCLDEREAVTNWEHGLFTSEDIRWAIAEIREHATIVGGDLCGAHSEPRYARWMQRVTAGMDHPKKTVNAAEAADQNARAFQTIWSALTQSDDRHARADQNHTEP